MIGDMPFWLTLAGVLALFGGMFYVVKSGRLTVYMVGLDIALINAEPIFNAVVGYDFRALITERQQGWVVLVATVLAGVARKRRQIRESTGV